MLTSFFKNKALSSLFLFYFLSHISLRAQVMDICKIIDIEQAHASKKINYKSAPQTARYNVTYYKLNLELDPSVRFVEGSVTTHFTTLDSNFSSIVFDFDNALFVDSVIHRGQSIQFSTAGQNTVEAFLPGIYGIGISDSVTIFYKGTPRGRSSNPPFARVNIPGGNLIWTLSEPYGAQQWWPCKNDLTDKADSIDIIVTTPQINRVASNGLLLSIDSLNNYATYHWKTTYPTVAYLVAIGVGKYDFYEEKYAMGSDSLLMHHFLFSSQTQAQSTNGILPFLQLFDSLFGEYPFIREKYGHASFTVGGGMEHQTISFMGSYGGELKAHELAHQWFGDKITCGSWSDLWLNESFATYLTGLTYNFGIVHPTSLWPTWLRLTENSGLQFPNGSVYRYGNDTLNVNSLFNNQVYAKGAITLHTLRWKMGDSAFFAGVKNYITDTTLAYGFARTPDLKAHLEAAYGGSLTEFFNDWIYGAGYPSYDSYWSQNGNIFSLNVRQTPSDVSVPFFDIPVPYRLTGPSLDTIIVVEPVTNNQTFNININRTITSIEFDPNNDIFAQEGRTTGLNNILNVENEVKVYPNPTQSYLTIKSPPAIQIQQIHLYDFQARLIRSYEKTEIIDVSALQSGMYMLVFDTARGRVKKKFTKLD